MAYPVMLELKGKRCLVAGAGKIAARKINSLIKSGALVTVVAPEIGRPVLEKQKQCGAITIKRRIFMAQDLNGVFLAVAATDRKKVNESICACAAVKGVLCNSISGRGGATFMNMAHASIKGMTVAVSSDGRDVNKAKKMLAALKKEL
jgi:siroheme synthase-like protein